MPALLLAVYIVAGSHSGIRSQAVREAFDQLNLSELLGPEKYRDDLSIDPFIIAVDGTDERILNIELLGLSRSRLAYRVSAGSEIVAIVVPATAVDGFNGFVDLLVAVDMTGHILAARVIRDPDPRQLSGQVDLIESHWVREFDSNSMRDIRRISWQSIQDENEYDQFVGASITPKAVANRIYDALIFVQSNRIVLMAGP